jgi:hypothetical protein
MSTIAVSNNQQSAQLHQFFENRVSDLRQLRQNLESGDVAGAQQSFRSLVQLGKAGPFPSSHAFLGNQRQQDFAAVGNALKSGDLQGARESFQNLIGDFHSQPVSDPATTAGPLVAEPIGTPARAINFEA